MPPLLFWDASTGIVRRAGRITVQLQKAANLAQFAPAGQLILPVPEARALRDALTMALRDEEDTP
jgi:hypothetical protein